MRGNTHGFGRLMVPIVLLFILFLVSMSPGYARLAAQAAPAAPQGAAPQGPPPCPGQPIGIQATGVYVNKPVESVMINGKPWGGAYWEPGMRSYWHCHAGGQMMMVFQGIGRVQKRGERIRTLVVGQSEYVGPGEEHWHGAPPDVAAQYLQVSISPGTAYWMEEVSRDDYLGNDVGIFSRNEFLRTGVRKQPDQPRQGTPPAPTPAPAAPR